MSSLGSIPPVSIHLSNHFSFFAESWRRSITELSGECEIILITNIYTTSWIVSLSLLASYENGNLLDEFFWLKTFSPSREFMLHHSEEKTFSMCFFVNVFWIILERLESVINMRDIVRATSCARRLILSPLNDYTTFDILRRMKRFIILVHPLADEWPWKSMTLISPSVKLISRMSFMAFGLLKLKIFVTFRHPQTTKQSTIEWNT